MTETLRVINFALEAGILYSLFTINFERLRKRGMAGEEILIRVGLGTLLVILAISGAKRLWTNFPADWSLPWLTVALLMIFISLAVTRSKQIILRKARADLPDSNDIKEN